jgi:hypothetical protein
MKDFMGQGATYLMPRAAGLILNSLRHPDKPIVPDPTIRHRGPMPWAGAPRLMIALDPRTKKAEP